MRIGLNKKKISVSILAVFMVFLMTMGTFAGAAQEGLLGNDPDNVKALLPENEAAEETIESEAEIENDGSGPVEIPVDMNEDYIDPILPNGDEITDHDDF